MAASSDAVLDNYSPGVLQRLGLDYPALRQVRPDIISVYMLAMGETGPLRDVLAYAPIIQALSGFMSSVGYQEDEPLVGELQAPWSDAVSSIHASLAIAGALRHRNRTGEGQYIEIAQLEATASMLGEAVLDYQMTGRVAGPQGNADIEWAPHNNYPCAGEDKWVAIAVATEEEWQGFCRALGNPDWCSGPRFSGRTGRMAYRRELEEYVAAWTTVRLVDEVVGVLQANGVAAMGLMNIEDQSLDPHWRARRTYAEIKHPHVGTEWVYGVPWVLGDTPGEVRTPAPTLGQHNEFVFQQLLGVPIHHLERLRSEKVIY